MVLQLPASGRQLQLPAFGVDKGMMEFQPEIIT
jgi:hypothetical protein